jgi:single-strand DNA-binding protein
MGRLTRDPEKRYTADNTPVTSFSIAVNRDKDRSDFFDCTAWRKTADFVSTYFAKGDMICIRGRIQNRDWTDKNGNARRSTEIVADEVSFCGGKKDKPDQKEVYERANLAPVEDDGQLPF